MQNVIEIECPSELLIGLNANTEDMAQLASVGCIPCTMVRQAHPTKAKN